MWRRMGLLKFEIPHQLSVDEVKKRLSLLADHWGNKYGVRTQWQGDSATIAGKAVGLTINAQLSIRGDKVSGEATDPGFLFRDKARKYLVEKFSYYLDPSKSLEDLKQA